MVLRALEHRWVALWALVAPALMGCGGSEDDEWATTSNQVRNTGWVELIVGESATSGDARYAHVSGSAGSCDYLETFYCYYSDCVADSAAAGVEYLSAGALSVAGASQPVEYTWQDSTKSYSFSAPEALVHGGETLTLRATGGAVPAHELSLVLPMPFTLNSPDLGQDVSIPTNQDFAFTWTSAAPGSVLPALLLDTGDASRTVTLYCEFPAAQGQGAMPKEMLARMAAAASTTTVSVSVDLAEYSESGISGWGSVEFYAAFNRSGQGMLIP